MQSKIEQQVMASVATVYTVRQLFSRTALKLYVCAGSLWGLGQLVWVSRVLENLSEVGFAGVAQFVFAALISTDVMVQVVLVIAIAAFASLLLDFVRTPARTFRFA